MNRPLPPPPPTPIPSRGRLLEPMTAIDRVAEALLTAWVVVVCLVCLGTVFFGMLALGVCR